MHYSGQAGKARKAAMVGQEREFEDFAEAVSLTDLVETAEEVFRENGSPTALAQEVLGRLQRNDFTESRKVLFFIYMKTFREASTV